MTFKKPELLLLLVVVPLVLLSIVWVIRRRKPSRTLTGLRACLWIVIVSALAEPRISRAKSEWDLAVLVDVSGSIPASELSRAESAIFQLAAAPQVRRLHIIAFAGEPLLVKKMQKDMLLGARTALMRVDETNIEKAIQFAYQFRDVYIPLKVVLFSDGAETRGHWMLEALNLARQGLVLDTLSPLPSEVPDLQVTGLTVDNAVYPGEWVVPVAGLKTDQQLVADCQLYSGDRLINSSRFDLSPGEHRLEWPSIRMGTEAVLLKLKCEASRDRHTENNEFYQLIRTESPWSGLYVNPNASDTPVYGIVETAANVIRFHQTSSLRKKDLEGSFDLIHLDNYSLYRLNDDEISWLEGFVNRGGGVLISGRQAFDGSVRSETVKAMLPVSWKTGTFHEKPTLAWVLVIDKSGSMAGQRLDLAKAGAKGVLESLDAEEQIAVLGFDFTPHWYLSFDEGLDQESRIRRVRQLQADGGTNIYSALEMAYRALKDRVAASKHILLLSDGRTHLADFEGLLKQLRSHGVTLSALAVGDGADTDLCKKLAEWGLGRFYFTDDAQRIPRIFAQETTVAREEAARRQRVRAEAGDFSRWVRELTLQSAPPLAGFVELKEKAGARVLLRTQQGYPLLTTWNWGTGQVGVFASDLSGEWARPWYEWRDFSSFYKQLAHELITRRGGLQGSVRQLHGGYYYKLEDRSVLPAGDYFLEGSVEVTHPSGRVQRVALKQLYFGRFGAPLDLDEPGLYLLRGQLSYQSGRLRERKDAWAMPYAEEFRSPSKIDLLRQASQWTGGRLNPPVSEILRGTYLQDVDIWPYLVLAAVILLWLELWGRRWSWSWKL